MACIRSSLLFFVNGTKIEDANVDPEQSLLSYLRTRLKLCGTKNGCSEGACGACTVMVSRIDSGTASVKHYSVNACLMPVCAAHGLAVTTVEGVGAVGAKIHPVQERLAKGFGTQCGFCSPGFVMAMYALLRNNPTPSKEEIEKQILGNLCRCTGYRPIVESFYSLAKGSCETCNGNCPCANKEVEDKLESFSNFAPYDPTQDTIFPPELQKLQTELNVQTLTVKRGSCTWHRPSNLDELLNLKSREPQAKLVCGHTIVGFQKKYRSFSTFVHIAGIEELRKVEYTDDGVIIGSANSLAELELVMRNAQTKYQSPKSRYFDAFIEMLQKYEHTAVKNVASIAGGIAEGSTLSDLNPLLLISRSRLSVIRASTRERREIVIDKNFFTTGAPGGRKTPLTDDDIILSVFVPTSDASILEFVRVFKQGQGMQRISAAMTVSFRQGKNEIDHIALAFGGVAQIPKLAVKTASSLCGKTLTDSTVELAVSSLLEEINIPIGSPGGMEQYRMQLCAGFLVKFFTELKQRLENPSIGSTLQAHVFEPITSTQVYSKKHDDNDKTWNVVGRPQPHQSAIKHTTGEALYTDDITLPEDACHVALVFSSRAHAKIRRIDVSKALALEGVIGVVDYKDLPPGSSNVLDDLCPDEELFAVEKVVCEGEIICGIVGESAELARKAARLVIVDYEDLPAILTIEEAIKANSFHPYSGRVYTSKTVDASGDMDNVFRNECDHVLTGEFAVGGQEHFYMETQVAVVVPRDGDEYEAIVSTQDLSFAQRVMCNATGAPLHKVVAKVKRVGGAFGGKETRFAIPLIPAALAAKKFGRAAKCCLQRDEDMLSTGTRNPAFARFKVGFRHDGEINALKFDIFLNAGRSIDNSNYVMNCLLSSIDCAYHTKYLYAVGRTCKTNLPSNTAFRGYGAPQAMLIREHVNTVVAAYLGLDSGEVRQRNLYKEGDCTPVDMPIINSNLERCWQKCAEVSKYSERTMAVKTFNNVNSLVKRGIAMTPLKHALVGYPKNSNKMNQACALVHAYLDGTVLVTHGGIEIGQGLHTKLTQIASQELSIPIDQVYIAETATDKIPNATNTGGSACTDLFGGAVKLACENLRERLLPYKTSNPSGLFKDWLSAAYNDRVNLSALGFYKTPHPNFWSASPDKDPNDNDRIINKVRYLIYGAACCECEVDCLTGAHKILQTDIVMDIGQSINPGADVGQIEGGFMQGYGLAAVERHEYSKKGNLLTKGAGGYSIPTLADVPRRFNVYLLEKSKNPEVIYSSKGIGEPPLVLGAGASFAALEEAVLSANRDAILESSPATADKIQAACNFKFTSK